MFLELAEALDCPECRSGFGLVAFVDEADGRRVIRGWLGCPMCEIEIPIEAGAMDFRSRGSPEGAAPTASEPPGESVRADGTAQINGPEDTAVRLAALLGLAEERGVIVLLGPGLDDLALPVVRFGERVEVLAWSERDSAPTLSVEELAEGINPLRAAPERPWPIRMGSLHAMALRGPAERALEEARRCLCQGGRIVLLDPGEGDAAAFREAGFEELARDDTTWVGERR
ncbi:MAG: hypothetical protein MJB57_00430 [Gemmatimonadetes bacterium]|nr:hypothetical protein [Gemmatimonadota bacterium]